MRIMVVGGTGFLGSAIAVAARNAGHDVTVMTRGGTPTPEGCAVLQADRMALPALPVFDAVIDTCAYAPDMVAPLRAAMGNAHYVLISSLSVYDALTAPGLDETTPARPANATELADAAKVADRTDAMAYGAAYGPLKRSCEAAAGDAAIIRLGLIVGAGDKTDRFTSWVRRVDQGGIIPVPDPADRPLQVIDVRDAAAFAVTLAQTYQSGTFNVTGPARPFADILETMRSVAGAETSLAWRPLQQFTQAGAAPWVDLPFIVPDDTDKTHLMNVSTAKATAHGLTTRPLADTVENVLHWDRARRDTPLTAGMSAALERDVLAADQRPAG